MAQSVPQWKLNYDSAQILWNVNTQKSLQLLHSAEKIALNDLGIYDENYLTIINDLGLAYAQAQDFKKAEHYLKQNLTIEFEIYPVTDSRVLQSSYNLATIILKSGDDIRAREMYKDIISKSNSAENIETYLRASENLAKGYQALEQYDSALMTVQNALSSQFSSLTIQNIYELKLMEGGILRKKKNYEEAILVLNTLHKSISSISPTYPAITNAISIELSLIDIEMGLYGKAEKDLLQLYRSGKTIPLDNDGTLLTELTNSLAYIYEKLGVYDKALSYYNESLSRCAQTYGRNSFGCVTIQSNIAGIYLKQGQIKESIVEYERFIRVIKQFSKVDNTVYLIALNNLATAYRQNDQYELAIQYFNEAYSTLEKKSLLSDDLAATVMNNLAVTCALKGEYERAAVYFEKVLLIKERVFGINSQASLDVVGNLAIAYWVLHRYNDALPLFQKSMVLALKEVKYVFPTLTETEQVQFYQQQKENFERFNTLAVQSVNAHPEFLVYMFNNQLLLKSLVFFTNKKRNALIHSKGHEQLKTLVNLVETKGVQLGHFYQMPLIELESFGISLSAMETQIDSLEKVIRHSMKNEEHTETDIEWKDVRESLKPNEALVDIIRFRKYDVLANTSLTASKRISIGFTDSIYYAVLITSAETLDHPKLVLLKNGASLEKRNLNYYRNTLRFDVDDNVSYSQYWKPLEEYVAGKRKIYITADGVYNQINLNAIHDTNGKFILEKYDLYSVLNSGQLIHRKTKSIIDFSNVVLMGDPDFNSLKVEVIDITSKKPVQYESLPGTRAEINGITSVLQRKGIDSRVFVNRMASEVNLKGVKSPSVLHIATHGFFSDSRVYLNEKVKNDFLFHSGIILSGTNMNTTNGNATFDTDGVVTAYDVMNLDLTNTGLVVLSACETGLGKIENGEGVYGLQRSFLQAGASDIVISLWKVDDNATKDLMIKFYSYLGMQYSKQEAFKLAQLDMLHIEHNPRLWGGFVMISGD